MKSSAILIALTASVLTMLPAASSQSPQSDTISIGDRNLIEPGVRVGGLKLGDDRARVLELFPKKAEDQEWENKCGTTLDWVDATNPTGRGDVFIRLKKGKVFQIESATTTFHTAEEITTFDRPEKIAHAYKDLHAYTLLTPPNSALGDRLHVRRYPLQGRKHGFDPLEEGGARRGQLDPAAGAHQQADPQGGLELGDLPAERRLGDREGLGGLPEVELARDLPEVDQVAQFKGFIRYDYALA